MPTLSQPTLPSLQQIYSLVNQFPIEQQLTIAEHIKKQALAVKWQQFIDSFPVLEPEITEEEIMQEIQAVRADRRAKQD